MGDGIWTADSYIPDMGTLGGLAGPGGYRGVSSDGASSLSSGREKRRQKERADSHGQESRKIHSTQISIRGITMTNKLNFAHASDLYRDSYASSQSRERALNEAIAEAKISGGYEQFLEIFDAFYADDVEVSSESQEEPIRGKAAVRSLLVSFLFPLHVMAEVGGLLVSVRHTTIPADAAVETHSAWTIDLVGASGTTCTFSWRVFRKWHGSRVVYEHHYDERLIGGPLTLDDLSFSDAKPAPGAQRPS
jgi:hypothetical protein